MVICNTYDQQTIRMQNTFLKNAFNSLIKGNIEKWTKNMNKLFTEEKHKAFKKYKKRYSILKP